MERNLQYGKSRSEAARDMEHQMMGQEAQGLGDSLVQSFGDLPQSKAGAMRAAWGGSIAGNSAALSEGYRQTGAEVMKFQPSRNDAEAVVEQAAAAAEQNPALPGEEPGAQAPAEADVDMANRQTVMGEDARMAEQAAQAQQQTAPAEPAQAAGAAQPVAKMGLEDLVKLRNRYKGGADKAFAAGGQFEGYDMDEVQNTINSLLSNKTRHNGKGTLQGY
jgi:hypothetical protein